MSLQDWLNNAWLTQHSASPRENTKLFLCVDRNLAE